MKIAAVTIAIAIAISIGVIAHAQTPTDPEGVFRAAVAAFNAGDAAASASYYTEDVTVTGLCPPANVCHGRAELQAQIEGEIAEGVQAEIRSLTVDGDTVVVALTEAAPGFAALGVERVYINITATVQNGKITSMTDELDLTDSQTAKVAQALRGEEETSLPPSGTGYAGTSGHAPWWPVAALLALGAGLIATGTRTSRKRA